MERLLIHDTCGGWQSRGQWPAREQAVSLQSGCCCELATNNRNEFATQVVLASSQLGGRHKLVKWLQACDQAVVVNSVLGSQQQQRIRRQWLGRWE